MQAGGPKRLSTSGKIAIIGKKFSGNSAIKCRLCEVPYFGGSALLLFYSVGASCNYLPQIMLNNVL